MLRSQNLIPLLGGAYQSRSYISDYEICENLFVENVPQETLAPTPSIHFPREGKRPLGQPANPGAGRGVFRTSNGLLFAGVGGLFYSIDTSWKFTQIGATDNLTTPLSVSDNGTTAVVVDGSPNGWTFTLANPQGTFAKLVDTTGTFTGSRRVDFADTFLAFATPGTNNWYVSLANQVSFNALAQAGKDSYPDPIQTLGFNIRQAWLLGTETSEIWFNAGSIPFPYQEWPNIFIPYGCVAPYSLAQGDVDLFWLSKNNQGAAIVLQTNGLSVKKVSTEALEYEWTNYPRVDDCIAGSFQQAGHTFVVFHFPTADKSWCYDMLTHQWHRRTWIDDNGVPHREKTSFYASVGADGGYPQTVVGQDWSTGQLYALDPQYYTDNGQPIICRRTFPHALQDMKFLTHTSFVADFETGDISGTAEVSAGGDPWSTAFSNAFGPLTQQVSQQLAGPALCMRFSNDGGKTWGNYRLKTLITAGHYRSLMRWRGLGMARDRVYELLWSYNGRSALQGAYLETIPHSA